MSFISQEKYKPNALPATIKIPLIITYTINGYWAGRLSAYVNDFTSSKDEIVIFKTEVEIALEIKEDITKIAVDSLNEAIKTTQAEAYKKIAELEAVREKFLQLTYQPEEVLPPEDDEIPF